VSVSERPRVVFCMLDVIVTQDSPKTRRELFARGVH
jgi:hypothetical protein